MSDSRPFPFTPKSNKSLRPGDYWAVPLEDGSFACGRVLELPTILEPGSSVSFLAGLMDWHGDHPADTNDLTGAKVLRHGCAHVLAITTTGGQILGNRDLSLDHIEAIQSVSAGDLMLGLLRVGKADRAMHSHLPSLSTWGFNVISVLANKQFLGGGLDSNANRAIW